MSKYKPSDALKIKQEIAQLQREREALQDELIALAEERTQLQRGISAWRGIFKRVEDSFAAKVTTGTAEVQQLSEKKDELQHDLTGANRSLALMRQAIADAKAEKPQDQMSFVQSVLQHYQRSIAEAELQKQNLTSEIAEMKKQAQALTRDLSALHVEKTQVVNQIQDLLQAILEGKRQQADVLAEIEKHQETIRTIEMREHDSRVMLARLSEQYRAVYNTRPHGSLDTRV